MAFEWVEPFLAELSRVPNVSAAARAAGISRVQAYEHRKADAAFSARWDDALEQSTDDLVGVAYERARAGSDTLTIFLLKCHRRQVYGDILKQQHSFDDTDDRALIERTKAALAGGRTPGADA